MSCQHLATLKAQVEDTSLAIGQREALVQEMAGTLDRAARGAVAADQRQERWARAVGLLDEFNSQNPGHPGHANSSSRPRFIAGLRGKAGGNRQAEPRG